MYTKWWKSNVKWENYIYSILSDSFGFIYNLNHESSYDTHHTCAHKKFYVLFFLFLFSLFFFLSFLHPIGLKFPRPLQSTPSIQS